MKHHITSDDANQPAPRSLPIFTRRQFFQALALRGHISQAQALAAAKSGELPFMQSFLTGLNVSERFGAEMLFSAEGRIRKDNPHVVSFLQTKGEDSETFWRFAISL